MRKKKLCKDFLPDKLPQVMSHESASIVAKDNNFEVKQILEFGLAKKWTYQTSIAARGLKAWSYISRCKHNTPESQRELLGVKLHCG